MVESFDNQGIEVVDLRFESLRDLQEDFGPFLSPEGFFLRDRSDFAASDVLRFRLMLPNEFVLIEGVVVVVWVRGPAEATPTAPFGAAVEFATLSVQGRELVERIVHTHVENGGRPFDMSRPADNGERQSSQPDEGEAQKASPTSGSIKFTVREDTGAGQDDQVVVGDAEPRLPFEADVKPEFDQSADAAGVRPVMPKGDDGSGVETPGAEAQAPPDTKDDPGQRAFRVETPEPLAGKPELAFSGGAGALEISLLDEQDSTADRKASWEHGEEESDSSDRSRGKRRSGLVWTLVVLVVLVGAAWVVWTQYPEYLPWGGPAHGGVTVDVDESNGGPLSSEAMAPLSDDDLEAVVEAAVEAVTDTDQPENSEPEPTEARAPVDVVSGPGSRVVDVKVNSGDSGTFVLIRADGSIERRRIKTSILPDPPRILVRIFGIGSPYRPFEIPVGTSEIRGIRIGHHQETRPPSLWLVLDRTDEDVEIRDVQTSRNVVRIEIGR